MNRVALLRRLQRLLPAVLANAPLRGLRPGTDAVFAGAGICPTTVCWQLPAGWRAALAVPVAGGIDWQHRQWPGIGEVHLARLDDRSLWLLPARQCIICRLRRGRGSRGGRCSR